MPGEYHVNRVGIIGIGNEIMSDDGVGVALLRRLGKQSLPENVELIELGVGGMNIIHRLDGLDKALLIDAVNFGSEPGNWKAFTPEEAEDMRIGRTESLHDCNILEAIKIAVALGRAPEEIIIFGVQPENVGYGIGLSESVAMGLDAMENELLSVISDLNDGNWS